MFAGLVVLDEIGTLLGHGDERRHVVVDQLLLERRQLAETVDLAHAVLPQGALDGGFTKRGGDIRKTKPNRNHESGKF